MQTFIYFFITFIFSLLLTNIMRHYVLRKKVLDIPNDRSSHQIPTPRGGGATIVVLFTLIATLFMRAQQIPFSLFMALMGGVIIACVGWLDDVITLRPLSRFLVHLISACWAVYWLGNYIDVNFVNYPLSIISIVWCINLYNFMDGIDGLAGGEGLFISLSTALALAIMGSSGISLLCLLLGASIAGFLVWNWSPAKIFMGDVGSSYLGYVFAVLALAMANFNQLPIVFWLVISSVFLCDATFTVIYRVLQGEPWYQAHKKHAYQRLVQSGFDHKTVTTSILFINVVILLPMAMLILYNPSIRFQTLSFVLVSFFIIWCLIGRKRIQGLKESHSSSSHSGGSG